MTLGWFIDCEQ